LLKFKLLGTAAGGGFPQWNCACSTCTLSRTQPQVAPLRLQQQAAFSADGEHWFLINASPDLRFQIESNAELHSQPNSGSRNTPIAGIILTSADLDQVLGVLLLREFQPLHVYASSVVQQVLEANSFFRMLERVPNQLRWTSILPGVSFQPTDGITCTPRAMLGSLPFYAKNFETSTPQPASIGLVIESNELRIAYMPSLPEITSELVELFNSCDIIMVDGTFWSDAELTRTQAGTPSARAIGHVPLSGEDGTLARLSGLSTPRKIFIHINNTNPILDPRSDEHRQVVEAGWEIGYDGWQLN
jgi:pyrroloquinoline quinone biosynthesis protein B